MGHNHMEVCDADVLSKSGQCPPWLLKLFPQEMGPCFVESLPQVNPTGWASFMLARHPRVSPLHCVDKWVLSAIYNVLSLFNLLGWMPHGFAFESTSLT